MQSFLVKRRLAKRFHSRCSHNRRCSISSSRNDSLGNGAVSCEQLVSINSDMPSESILEFIAFLRLQTTPNKYNQHVRQSWSRGKREKILISRRLQFKLTPLHSSQAFKKKELFHFRTTKLRTGGC